jgi:hypothetical protein
MAGANWDNYNLPAIWAMLEPDNVCTGADKVLAWDSLATSVRDQHKRLQAAGQKLADAWPPEKNDSAKIFLTQIDILLDSMQETMNAAASTHAGLRGVMAAISKAQADVRELGAGRESVSTDLMPRFIDHAEDEYDAKAQQAMREMESAIADHTKQITAPSLFTMKPGSNHGPGIPDQHGGSVNGAGSTVRATPVEVPVPHDPVLPEPVTGAGAGESGVGSRSGSDPTLGIGPGLSGVAAAPPPPALTGPATTLGLPTTAGPGAGGLPGGAPIGVGLLPGGGGGGFGSGMPGMPGGRAAVGSRRAVSMRRGLPAGAVLGEGGLAGGRGVGVGQMPVGGPAGRRGGQREQGESSIGGEADERWATAEGVAPVIAPDNSVIRHDPGPGVLGFDR